jgi:flagellar biosynthesis protein FlhB
LSDNQEDREKDDLSEEASPYKLEDFRKKGKVAQSRELTGLVGFLVGFGMLYLFSTYMGELYFDYFRRTIGEGFTVRTDLTQEDILGSILKDALKVVMLMGLPVAVGGAIASALGSFGQIGAIFSTEPLKPDFQKINPISGLKQYFTMKKVYDALRLIARAACVAIVAAFIVKSEIIGSPRFLLIHPEYLMTAYGNVAVTIFISLFVVLLVFACLDLWIQRWDYGKNVRLTKKEQKQETKDKEGDPLIKSRIRAIQREMARRRMMDAVKTADVIVTNPTHFAVAIKYEQGGMSAPKVVAKGTDFLAQKIKKVAQEAGIVVMESPPLARTLYKTVKIGQNIPRALYKAVAEILAHVYKLKGRRL